MRIRKADVSDSAAIAKVQLDSWRSAFAGMLPDDYLAHFTYEEREQDWQELFAESDDFVYVAENDVGEVVGFACTRPETDPDAAYQAELTSLHLLPAYRGQGIGQQLFEAVVAHLRRQGVGSMWLWVLAQNRARRFYERLGGRLVDEQVKEIGGAQVVEVAYAWRIAE